MNTLKLPCKAYMNNYELLLSNHNLINRHIKRRLFQVGLLFYILYSLKQNHIVILLNSAQAKRHAY